MAPVESTRSLTPTIRSLPISGSGLLMRAMLRWCLTGMPSAHWVPRPISVVSSKPAVTSRPSRGPVRSISRFIASVVE